jgi:hypothetical protein
MYVIQAVRAFIHLAAVIIITIWALSSWPLPMPGVLMGAAAFALTVLVWALFLSPKPVLHTDRFGQGLIELLLIAGAVAALLALGVIWLVPVFFGMAAAIVGYLATAKR